MKIYTSRRELLGGAAAAFAGAHISFAAPVTNDDAGFKLGVASYSMRKLSRADAIKGLEALKVRYVNIKDFHAPMKSTPAKSWRRCETISRARGSRSSASAMSACEER